MGKQQKTLELKTIGSRMPDNEKMYVTPAQCKDFEDMVKKVIGNYTGLGVREIDDTFKAISKFAVKKLTIKRFENLVAQYLDDLKLETYRWEEGVKTVTGRIPIYTEDFFDIEFEDKFGKRKKRILSDSRMTVITSISKAFMGIDPFTKEIYKIEKEIKEDDE